MRIVSMCITVWLFSLTLFAQPVSEQKTPKYIFLFIGDGMGVAQMQAADIYMRSVMQDSLRFMYLPGKGFLKTHSANSKITCSAAAGTAMATGTKTNNGLVGLAPNGKDTLYSFMYAAQKAGMKTGVISCVSIDHATPAAFYASSTSRNNYHDISLQLARSQFDFFCGGGFKAPIEKGVNAYTKAKNAGYVLVSSPDSLFLLPKNEKVFVYAPATLFPYRINNRENPFTLSQVTKAAITHLVNDAGFVIMVEGGKIDWSCHANDAATTIHEVIEFNDAIKQALEFYYEYPDETLIIVTADHETGGMSLGSVTYPYHSNIALLQHQNISYDQIENILKNEFTKNPKLSFKELMEILQKYYVFGNSGITLTKDEQDQLLEAYTFVTDRKARGSRQTQRFYNISNPSSKSADKAQAIVLTLHRIIAEKAGIGWTTYAHTGIMVPIKTIGVGSEYFTDVIDNTDIAKYILELISQQ